MGRGAEDGLPSAYAVEKLPMLQRRRRGPFLAVVRPMAQVAFPGADPDAMLDALLGFTAFSTSSRENTTDAVLSQRFHEVGLFQVPAGPRSGPAPNPDPGAANNAYTHEATSPLVKRLLGQPVDGPGASTRHNAWKPSNDNGTSEADVRALREQSAVGIANLLDDWASIRAKLRGAGFEGLAGTPGSPWMFFLMFTAMSRGPTGAYNRLRGSDSTRAADPHGWLRRLNDLPEDQRIVAFATMVDEAVRARLDDVGGEKGRGGSAYGIVRSLQKLRSGQLVAARSGGRAAWFAPTTLAPDLEQRIAQAAYDEPVSAVATGAAAAAVAVVQNAVSAALSAGDVAKVVGGAVALLAFAGAAYYYFEGGRS